MCCIELNTDMKRYLAEKPYGVNYRDFLDVTKKEIGPITTTRVMRGQVPSGTFSSRTSKKVSTKASAIRTPCTTR